MGFARDLQSKSQRTFFKKFFPVSLKIFHPPIFTPTAFMYMLYHEDEFAA